MSKKKKRILLGKCHIKNMISKVELVQKWETKPVTDP